MQKKLYISPQCALVLVDGSDDVLQNVYIHVSGSDMKEEETKPVARPTFDRREIFFEDTDEEEDQEGSVLDDIVSW